MFPRSPKVLRLMVFSCGYMYCLLLLLKVQDIRQNVTEQKRALEKEFHSRSAHIKSECAASPPPLTKTELHALDAARVSASLAHHYTDVHLKATLKDLLYIPHRNITWCLVPKVASTSMSQALLDAERSHHPASQDPLQVVLRHTFRSVEPSKVNETINTSLKFLFTRHPFHRLVSAYRNKLEDSMAWEDGEYFYKTYGRRIVERYGIRKMRVMEGMEEENEVKKTQKDSEENINKVNEEVNNNFFEEYKREPSFQEYVEYLLDTDPYEYDEHWKPIALQCHVCRFQYDFIIKYESFKEEIDYLVEILKEMKRVPKDFSLEWENRGGTNRETVGKYLQQISQEKLWKLFDKYRHDFYYFGYTMEEFTTNDETYRH